MVIQCPVQIWYWCTMQGNLKAIRKWFSCRFVETWSRYDEENQFVHYSLSWRGIRNGNRCLPQDHWSRTKRTEMSDTRKHGKRIRNKFLSPNKILISLINGESLEWFPVTAFAVEKFSTYVFLFTRWMSFHIQRDRSNHLIYQARHQLKSSKLQHLSRWSRTGTLDL